MNMMTRIDVEGEHAARRVDFKPFLDENGQPSSRCGPDLTEARPIDEVIEELGRLRNSYAPEFWRACRASGIDVSARRDRGGEEHVMLGFPMDDQEALRRPRFEALSAQLRRSEKRRHDVIQLAKILGRFIDDRRPVVAKPEEGING